MKSLFPIILIVVAGGLFFFEVKPLYTDVQQLLAESGQYDQALKIADQLTTIRSDLSAKLKSFTQADLARLDHFLPRNLDTVRIILDVDGIAARNSIKLAGLGVTGGTVEKATGGAAAAAKPSYEVVNIAFSFSSSYPQGIRFIEDLERSLRLLDTSSVKIKSSAKDNGLYDFGVTLRAYWINR